MIGEIKLLNKLLERRLVKQMTSEVLPDKLCLYLGFDLTAPSLHIGSLVPLQVMKIAKLYGHKTICLLGSGTTLVGDPTWKSKTRPMLDSNEIKNNAAKIKAQIQMVLEPDYILDNMDWLHMDLLKFLREVGAFFSINQLLDLETFAKRLENQEHLSFLELSYPLLGAYDFLYLNQKYGCNVQVGGSDQWGNIVQGISYVQKVTNSEVYGITSNLLTISGDKMGKTIGGTIFLDQNITSVYDFWQFWRNLPDQDLEDYFMQLTQLSLLEIKDLLGNLTEAKKVLADIITSMVHGVEASKEVRNISEAIFERKEYQLLPLNLIEPHLTLEKIVFELKLTESISEARRAINGGAVQIDGVKVLDHNFILNSETHILCFGKQKYFRLQAK